MVTYSDLMYCIYDDLQTVITLCKRTEKLISMISYIEINHTFKQHLDLQLMV